MKKILIIIALFLTTARLFAQDCSHYVFMKKGRTIETATYNAAEKVMQKDIMLVNNVTTAGGTTTATLTAQNFDQNGSLRHTNTIIYKCDNGTLIIDISSLIPQQANIKFSTALMKYPSNMTVGQQFENVDMIVEMNLRGKTIKSHRQITERKVVGEESLIVPAGTWKCFRMTYKLSVTYEGFNIPPANSTVTEWYAPNFALIQWQSGVMVTKFTAIKN